MKVSEAGSARRRRETFRDLDVIATSTDPAGADRALRRPRQRRRRASRRATRRRPCSRTTASGSTCASCRRSRTGTCCSTSPARRSTTSRCARTPSAAASRSPSTAVTNTETGEELTAADEEELYAHLGYAYIPPELRENGGELEAARKGELPVLVERADLRGDLHCHSTWSDGKATIEQMALAAQRARARVPRAVRPLAAAPRRPAAAPVGGDRRAQRAPRAVPDPEGDRGEHPRQRRARRRRRGAASRSTG